MVAAREVLHTAALGGLTPRRSSASPTSACTRRSLDCSWRWRSCCSGHSGTGRYALAGQPPPIVRRSDGRSRSCRSPRHRLPLGALRGGSWDLLQFEMGSGDLLFLYSDGLTEAQNHAGEFFGEKRLHTLLAGADGEPQAVVARVLDALESFTPAPIPTTTSRWWRRSGRGTRAGPRRHGPTTARAAVVRAIARNRARQGRADGGNPRRMAASSPRDRCSTSRWPSPGRGARPASSRSSCSGRSACSTPAPGSRSPFFTTWSLLL